jgi:hypothetical protein
MGSWFPFLLPFSSSFFFFFCFIVITACTHVSTSLIGEFSLLLLLSCSLGPMSLSATLTFTFSYRYPVLLCSNLFVSLDQRQCYRLVDGKRRSS